MDIFHELNTLILVPFRILAQLMRYWDVRSVELLPAL
jgi:hypothetical protein